LRRYWTICGAFATEAVAPTLLFSAARAEETLKVNIEARSTGKIKTFFIIFLPFNFSRCRGESIVITFT
jgi:hypothetical protein